MLIVRNANYVSDSQVKTERMSQSDVSCLPLKPNSVHILWISPHTNASLEPLWHNFGDLTFGFPVLLLSVLLKALPFWGGDDFSDASGSLGWGRTGHWQANRAVVFRLETICNTIAYQRLRVRLGDVLSFLANVTHARAVPHPLCSGSAGQCQSRWVERRNRQVCEIFIHFALLT